MERMTRALRVTLVAAAMMVAGGCAPPADRGGFDSANPATRLYAIRQAGHAQDRAALPHLVASLESDDAAERVLAIQALQRITGERHGYDPHGTPGQRHAAVLRWQAALQTGATP